MIKTCLNPEGHQNPISGSKGMAILLKGRILPIGGASAGEGLYLQPAQQTCLLRKIKKEDFFISHLHLHLHKAS